MAGVRGGAHAIWPLSSLKRAAQSAAGQLAGSGWLWLTTRKYYTVNLDARAVDTSNLSSRQYPHTDTINDTGWLRHRLNAGIALLAVWRPLEKQLRFLVQVRLSSPPPY